MIEFVIYCIPPKATHQASLRIMKRRDGTKFVGKFAKSKGKKAQNDLMSLLRPHVPTKPLETPVTCEIRWVYPYRKAESKKAMSQGLIPCDTRPDCDNLFKTLGDCMTRLGFWLDDSQVYGLHFSKFWGEVPRIEVKITEKDSQ